MDMQDTLPIDLSGLRGGLVLVESARGSARREALRRWAADLANAGTDALLLPCDYRESGMWGGVHQWLGAILPGLEQDAPALAARHALELSMVFPARKGAFAAPATLTEMAEGSEAIRSYAVDRAHRASHGIIDLLDAWYRKVSPPRAVICDGFDRACALSRRFFAELLRRRGGTLGFTLVVTADPGRADEIRAAFAPDIAHARVRLDLPADEPRPSPGVAAFGEMLREMLARNEVPSEDRFPDLLRFWEEGGRPAWALPAMLHALAIYNHYGFYEDALPFLEPLLEEIDRVPIGEAIRSRWTVIGAVFNCLVALGQVDRAYRMMIEQGLGRITEPLDRARVCYACAMTNARFAEVKDFAAAERFLEDGARELAKADPGDAGRAYVQVFLDNALAYIRSRQGRPREAIELCASGHERIRGGLGGRKHTLQRSVLLYNIAQVYAATGQHLRAIEHYDQALELDPNYSEYHNERANVYLAMGRYDDAIRDYHRAIELSAPYPEVWTNLGQCFRKMGRLDDAAGAYSRALDLDPVVDVARVARAQVLSALGRADEARADYEAALALNPDQPAVLANLAVLRYRAGDVAGALGTLDRAIALDPGNAAIYRNRAVALEDLGRPEDAARDLATWLSLAPPSPEHAAVEEKIAALTGAAVAA